MSRVYIEANGDSAPTSWSAMSIPKHSAATRALVSAGVAALRASNPAASASWVSAQSRRRS